MKVEDGTSWGLRFRGCVYEGTGLDFERKGLGFGSGYHGIRLRAQEIEFRI